MEKFIESLRIREVVELVENVFCKSMELIAPNHYRIEYGKVFCHLYNTKLIIMEIDTMVEFDICEVTNLYLTRNFSSLGKSFIYLDVKFGTKFGIEHKFYI